jgi:hypothetical protein
VSSDSARVSPGSPVLCRLCRGFRLAGDGPGRALGWKPCVIGLVSSGWPSAVVLDAGCGTGRHAAAQHRVGRDASVCSASTSRHIASHRSSTPPSGSAPR